MLTTTVSPVMDMGGNAVEGATSSMVRSADDIALTVGTTGLTAGVYTLSVIALNNPEFCAGECGPDDYDREEVNASLVFGGGTIVDATGQANFQVQLSEGDASGAISGAGVIDSYDAEIHFMIRSKGPAVPELLQQQLTTIDGGCPASGCSDVQIGVHTSPITQVSVNPMQDRTHDNIPIPGTTARLTRQEDRVTVRIDTNVLPPGAYTVWLASFNNPEHCIEVCDSTDLERPGVDGSLMWANTGGVVGDDGEATFIGTRFEGDSNVIHRGYSGGVINSYKAEYHLVIRSHGPVIPELLEEQLSSLNGGCPPNTCQDLQASIPHFPHDGQTPDLLIKSLEVNSSGFVAEFTSDLDMESLNLYDAVLAGLGPADVVLQGAATGPVSGSVVVDPSTNELTFLKTGAPLVPDIYTLTLHSGESGVKGDRGSLLETNGDGTPYSSTFTVPPEAANSISVGVPDFVRGPGQSVNLPADSSSGIPLSISDGTGVREVELSISYDPELLEVTAATIGAAMPPGATLTLDISTDGLAIVNVTSPTALPAGANFIANLQASVPPTIAPAMYRQQQVIDVHSATVRDGDANLLPVIDDDGLHLVSHLGDVSGNGRINATDAAQIARIAAALDSGFASTPLTDPNIPGDISGNDVLNAADASLVAQHAALIDVPEIPDIPAGVFTAGSLDRGLPKFRVAIDSVQPTAVVLDTTGHDSDAAALSDLPHPAVDLLMIEMERSLPGEEMRVSLEEAVEELFLFTRLSGRQS